MKKWLLALILLVAAPRAAHAICVLDAVSGMAFGSYDVYSSAPLETSGTITVRCLVSLFVTVEVSKGSSTSFANRTMALPGGTGTKLNYNLYRNAGRTQIWGDGTSGTTKYGPVLVLISTINIPIYGSIPAGQDVTAGSYSDTVVVTLNY